MLRQSAEKGDFLLVGVDSDANSRRYKKRENGPIIPQDNRIEIIQNLSFVDGVFLLDTEFLGRKEIYRNLYKEFKPDVITMGRNFFGEEMIRNDLRGLKKTSLVKIDSGYESTTEIIERIQRRQ